MKSLLIRTTLLSATLAVAALVSTQAVAHGVAPAPVVVKHGYGHGNGHGYRGGYWSGSRWIAPVVIGAGVLGAAAYYNGYYAPPVVTYVPQPSINYVQPAVVYAAPPAAACDTFCQADRDQNGVIDRVEAGADPAWSRWFNEIDQNRDGVITRQEVDAWYRARSAPVPQAAPALPLPPLPPLPALPPLPGRAY